MVRKCKVCNIEFKAKTSDVKRGWAKHCSKSCAATTNNQKTGNYQRFVNKHSSQQADLEFNGDVFSNEDYFDRKGD